MTSDCTTIDLTDQEIDLFDLNPSGDWADEVRDDEDTTHQWSTFIFTGTNIPDKYRDLHPGVRRVEITQMTPWKWAGDTEWDGEAEIAIAATPQQD